MPTVNTSYTGFYIDTSKTIALVKFKGIISDVQIKTYDTIGGLLDGTAPSGTMFILKSFK